MQAIIALYIYLYYIWGRGGGSILTKPFKRLVHQIVAPCGISRFTTVTYYIFVIHIFQKLLLYIRDSYLCLLQSNYSSRKVFVASPLSFFMVHDSKNYLACNVL